MMKVLGWGRSVLAVWGLYLPVLCSGPSVALAAQEPPGDSIVVERDLEYGRVGNHVLRLDIHRPRGPAARPRPALLLLHGGGWKTWPDGTWDKSSTAEVARAFANQGYWVASAAYRLSDVSPFPAAIQDCRRAVRFIRSHATPLEINADRIGVWGFSAGAHLALLLGLAGDAPELEGGADVGSVSSRVQAVCSWSGPTDFTDRTGERKLVGEMEELVRAFMGGSFEEKAETYRRASPLTYATRGVPPILLIHGDQDQLVPFDHSRVMLEKLNAAGADATLLPVKGGGHLFFKEGGQDPPLSGMIRSTVRFFDSHLKGPRVLFLTHSAGFLHDVVKRPAPEKLSLAEEKFSDASKGRFELVASQDLKEVTAGKLKEYQAIVFYTSGELPIEKEVLLNYVRNGGRFACVHNGMATLMKFPPYGEMVGGTFDGHPWNQEVGVRVEDRDHASTAHLGASFRIKDEIYQVKDWDRKNVHVLLSIDPSTVDLSKGKRADGDYALAWTKSYGSGRVFYTALGHYPEVWKDERFLKHLVGGVEWLLADSK